MHHLLKLRVFRRIRLFLTACFRHVYEPNERKSVTITIHSEPFHDDPEGAESYYTALGRALVLWGRFENHLFQTLLAINNLPEAEPLRPRELPVSFKQQAKLWRKFFRSLPVLASMRDAAPTLISDAGDANQDRAVIVHGHFNGFITDDPLTARFNIQRHKGEKIIFEHYDVPISALENMVNTFDALNTRMLPIGWKVASLYWRQSTDTPQAPSGSQ